MIEVIATGGPALVQDLGRPGYQSIGVSRAGAADRAAHRLANRLVGNPEDAATLELTSGGLTFRAERAVTVALAGAGCPGLAWLSAVSLAAGSVVRLGRPDRGLRSYLAVRGGISVAPVLGSRSTDTLSGLGPAPVRPGDRLPIGTVLAGAPGDAVPAPRTPTGAVRVLPGPRQDWFRDPAALVRTAWRVQPASDRVGIRLDGPALTRRRSGELASEPTLPGAIQVPPDGLPIVLFRDAPVTGGYPVIAVAHSADLDRLAHLRPGDVVRFALE